MNKHLKFIATHRLQGDLLKKFVSRELWVPALGACEHTIIQQKEAIVRLEGLKTALQEEVEG